MSDRLEDSTRKRGITACSECRRAKNRCIPQEGDACARCAYNGLHCTFERPNKGDGALLSKKQALENKVDELQNGQAELKQLASQNHENREFVQLRTYAQIGELYRLIRPLCRPQGVQITDASEPALPGFSSPWLAFGNYGILHRATPRRDAEVVGSPGEDSADDFEAPNLIIDTLVHGAESQPDTADRVASEQYARTAFDMGTSYAPGHSEGGAGRKRKRRPDTPPRKPFSDVITKRMISMDEGRELWNIFFEGCHWFVPLWDTKYDLFDAFRERSPFGTNSILAVAARIRARGGPVSRAFYCSLEEAQGIARSTLFGPVVRKEVVMAMLVLSIWSRSGWLPCGHALRMAMDMNLHQALARLCRSEGTNSEEDRDMVVSARIWLSVYLFDNRFSIDNGKPLAFRDESLVENTEALLRHPLASDTDVRLVAAVELIKLRIGIVDQLNLARAGTFLMSSCRRLLADLGQWHINWRCEHLARFAEDHVLLSLLDLEYASAQLWTVCIALKGCRWRELNPAARETAFMGKEAAHRCLDVFTQSPNLIRHLRYATREPLVAACFAAVYLLRMAVIYPESFDLPGLTSRVEEVAQILVSECNADRFALALRVVLAEYHKRTRHEDPIAPLFDGQMSHNLESLTQSTIADQNDILADLGLDMAINWEHFGDPQYDPGFTWQTTSSGTQGAAITGSLRPDTIQEPFESWGLPINMTDYANTADPNQWFRDLPDTADDRGEAW